MKKLVSCIVLIILIVSCGKNKTGNMIVNGTIEGLKKGTLYLQKRNDTTFVSVDSVQLNGEGIFKLVTDIESPEIYFIQLDKINDKVIPFFGEKGEISISSKLSKFTIAAKISGSSNQELLEEHNAMIRKFNVRQLELIKDKFEAQKENDTALVSKIELEEKNLIKRKYYYTVNFAVRNAQNEVAPYLALTELYYANIKLLDTINNSLSKKVKDSKYGIDLDAFIKNIKKNEN